MIPALLAFGTLCYSLYWLRYRGSGLHLRIISDLKPLVLLVLAALIYVGCELATSRP